MNPVEVVRGDGPVILAIPHAGLFIPDDIEAALNDRGVARADADWHVDRLYDGLLAEATLVRATYHRYVIDPNRDPAGASLYPGQNTTALCPITDFFGKPVYRDGCEPDDTEIARRRETYHAPYHAALAAEINRARDAWGLAVLYDCHSIRSEIPFLFDGVLPDFNIGTNDAATCAPQIEKAVADICRRAEGYTHVVNGRFKGGWTTRHYGRPAQNIHAIQMELAQRAYMDENPPWTWRETRAERLRAHLKEVLTALDGLARRGVLSVI